MSGETTNEKQIDFWNADAGTKWVRMQESLDRQLGPFSDALFDSAAFEPGSRVLDIGCGCGATTLEVARRVGPEGKITGADISRPMLDRARQRVEEEKMGNVDFIEADAQTHAFEEGAYDAFTSRFGIMFFADPPVAFANIRKALKPGGRAAFICWRPMVENPWVTVPLMAAADHVELPPPPEPGEPGPFSLGDKDLLTSTMTKAGFDGLTLDPLDLKLAMGGAIDIDSALDFVLEMGPVGRLVADLDGESLETARAAIRTAIEPYATPEGVVMDWAAWIVQARNPA